MMMLRPVLLAALAIGAMMREEDLRATVVIQGFNAGRRKGLCRTACTMQAWESVEAVLVVWNNDRSLWAGCWCDIAESADWVAAGGKHAARVYFSSGDDLDNHYAVPGRAGKGCDIPNFKPLLSRSFQSRCG